MFINRKYLIIAALLISIVSFSLLFGSKYKKTIKNEISFYESKKTVGQILTNEEIVIMKKFRSQNQVCFNQINEKAEILAIKNAVNDKIKNKSSKRVKISISELEKVLGFDPRPVMKKVSRCNFMAKKNFSKNEKLVFKSAMKKLKIEQKVELYNGVAR